MRLTLRTLLAYIDRVLTPTDHDELHRRIQQNEAIGRLTQRIERLTGQPEMLTPRLSAPGLAGNPNAIAEYLDDVLPGGSVPELERVCLESDEYLAELAHCHHLLATAIRTPVTVPESLRARAIELIDPVRRSEIEQQLLTRSRSRKRAGGVQVVPVLADEAEAVSSTDQHVDAASPIPAPMMASGGGSIRPEGLDLEDSKLAREVPEYLVGRTSTGVWRMPLAIAVVAIILCAMVWQALGPWQNVRKLLVARDEPNAVFADDPPLRIRELEPAEADDSVFHELVVSQEEPPLVAEEPAAGAASGDEVPDATADAPVSDISESAVAPPLPGSESTVESSVERGASIEASESTPPLPAGVTEIDVTDGRPPVPAEALPGDGQPSGALADNPLPSDGLPSDGLPSEQATLLVGPRAMWTPQDDAQRTTAILLSTQDGWRLARPEIPTEADEWIVPPYTRTQLTLAGQVKWLACGPSYLSFGEQAGSTTVTTRLCRAFVQCPPQQVLQLQTPAGTFIVRPTSGELELAIEVGYRPASAGSIVEPGVMRAVFVATVTEGTAAIEEVTKEDGTVTTQLAVGEAFGAVAGERSSRFVMRSIPEWYRSSVSRASDKLAMQDAAKMLAATQDQQTAVAGQIAAMVDSRRAETAALAVQISLLTGSWDSFVNRFLDDARFRNYWTSAIDLSRQVVMADGKQAEMLRQAMLDKHGPEQGELAYRLLTGDVAEASTDNAAVEPLTTLVGQLENLNLTIRVLTGYQLEKLTGQSWAYQPHAPNKASVQQWRRELAMKRISLLPKGDILYERVAKTTAP